MEGSGGGGGMWGSAYASKAAGARARAWWSGWRGVGGSGRWMRAGQSSESRRRSQRSDWRSMKEERFFPPPPLAGLPRPAAD